MPFPKAIITKPFLVADSEYKDLGLNINLVGYDSFNQVAENTKQHVSPKLLNWVEPYEVSGVRKTLFYTEVNTNFQVGDRVYIVNGNYDNDTLIQKDKYKKGRDGYKVLKVEQCKIVLDIDYTGALPYNDDSFDDYIKLYYIDDKESFINANRQVTTRGGKFDYKFNYGQNNIAFIDKDMKEIYGWGLNAGVSGTPGFFVRESREGWSKISDELIYLGSFSVALSPTYKNNGKMVVMDGTFVYNGIEFKEGFVYRWNVGPTNSSWQVDPSYSPALITKSNFRNGTFNGKFNNGLYGTQQNRLDWTGNGTWNGGSMLNTRWQSGTINSKIALATTYRANFDEYGIPFQKSYTANNGGFGFNYVFDSEMEKTIVDNGNFYRTTFDQPSATFSVVEKHVLGSTYSLDNRINKAFFELCHFRNIQIDGGEIKNSRVFNTRVSNSKTINSYFDQSVIKDSTYVSDKIIKILGYDEWNMSEYLSLYSGLFSTIRDVNSKIYKFYISKESFRRMKSEDTFYIKGLKVKNSPNILEFFDSKFRLTSWTEFYDDYSTGAKSITGVDPYSFYKRGFEIAAFLSTPEENAYIVNSQEGLYNISGVTYSRYNTTLSGKNPNAAYSIDIIVSRHDLNNKNQSMDSTSEWDSLNPKNYNYSSDVIVGTTSLPTYLGSNIDISNAYILDSDFGGGIIETSDWNSGHHINYNNDVVITSVTSSGLYSMEIDNENDYLIAYTGVNNDYPERIGKDVISKGDIVFLNAIDYDTRGMVQKVTLISTGSGYSSSSKAINLVNTKVSSVTMSSAGTYYRNTSNISTYNTTGKGTGLTLDITAKEIGAVMGITYSAPMSGGGSYSMALISSVPTNAGPIATGGTFGLALNIHPSYTHFLLQDDDFGTVTGIPTSMNGGVRATFSNFGPPQTPVASGATGVGAIFVTGPIGVAPNGVTSSPRSLGVGLTLDYMTSANGAITKLSINTTGSGYEVGEVFRVEGGNATFSITSISKGEMTGYKINNPGEDYLKGDVLEILNPYEPNFQFGTGITASVVVTSITVSSEDTKGLTLDILASSGTGNVIGVTISRPGLYYNEGDIFTISGGNLDALLRIDSVAGSLVRLNDTYKVIENDRGRISLKDMGQNNTVAGLTAYGCFYTTDAKNRWGYISKTKIDKTKIKSGLFKRAYIKNSLIRDIDYDSTDRNLISYDRIKNTLISDSLFSNGSNILSSATYLYSSFVGGTDIWNDGIINKSIINGMTFSKGIVRQSSWINGNLTGGMFYNSKSFDAKPTIDRPNYLNDRVRSYYMIGNIGATLSNNRYSWRNGKMLGGQFYKSDWENGVIENGTFFYSKFYAGTINGGKIGTRAVAAADTRIYNGLINYTTVDNANVYAEDTSYTGLSNSRIEWMNGVFNSGIFGSNNDDVLGSTVSNVSYKATITSLPIADYKITTANVPVSDTEPILGNFEIDAKITLKHTYLGDLIINLMSPNGKIINLKKRYSAGSNDNLISTIFTSDSTKPSLEIGTAPYTGEFRFDALPNQGVYYDLNNRLLPNIAYDATENVLPQVIDYRSFPPSTIYESDRYLVIATSSDPNWTSSASTEWAGFVGKIVERSSSSDPTYMWELYSVNNNDKVFVKNKLEYLKYLKSRSFTGWTKSYHSNATKISELLNTDKTVTGNWMLMVMDCAALDSGFVENFEITFNYKTSYIIKTFKNDAVWHDGIFNGGQFIDLGVWRNGKFNGGKFISTYGYKKSGSYIFPSNIISEYSWQGGEFNGGEFGNESLLANSTWFNGEFNGGVFKGKLWNNGVFTYGEFKGGSSLPAIGKGIKSANAGSFVDSFKNEYYGVWRKGTVSDKKDNFVTDKKIFTAPVRSMSPAKTGKTAKFTNMLWISGTFDHPSGEIINSVWLNGLFKMGKFQSSAFNPYVKRDSDIEEFVKDDSCIWENGRFVDSEFHMSKWKYGQFISGTAVGMIWKNGISNYMNAYNVFWEGGVWRNGNWYGSNFEYRGRVDDGFAREILNRGIEWSGTSSCHIWNMFESDVDTTSKMVSTLIARSADATIDPGDSFTTTNLDDLGADMPIVEFNPVAGDAYSSIVVNNASKVTVRFKIISNGGAPITQAGIIYRASADQTTAQSNPPQVTISGGLAVKIGNTEILSVYPAEFDTATWNAVNPNGSLALGIPTSTTPSPDEFVKNFVITGLDSSKAYSIQAFAVNGQCDVSSGPAKSAIHYFRTAQKNNVYITALTSGSYTAATGELYSLAPGHNSGMSFVQSVLAPITLKGTLDISTSPNMPAPSATTTPPGEKGFLYIVKNIGDAEPTTIDVNTSSVVKLSAPLSGLQNEINYKFISASPNKVYYIKAFARNEADYGYSNDTLVVQSGATNSVVTLDSILPTATIITGNVTDNGGSTNDLERGFIVRGTTIGTTIFTTSPSLLPTNVTATTLTTGVRFPVDSGQGAGIFSKNIDSFVGLNPGGSYQVIAYAYKVIPGAPNGDYTNCRAFDYSNTWTSFVAAATPPTVTTTDGATSITPTGANLAGIMVSKNGENVTAGGMVLTTTSGSYLANPTLDPGNVAATSIPLSAPNSSFSATPTGLVQGQRYYYKAWAQNLKGYSYGEERTFMTLPEISTPGYTTTKTEIVPSFTVTRAVSVSSKGIIWISAAPTPGASWWTSTSATKTTDVDATTTLTSATSLIPNTEYLVVAYATNTDILTLSTNTPKTYYTAANTVVTKPDFTTSANTVTTVITAIEMTISIGLSSTAAVKGTAALTEKGIAYGTTSAPITEKISTGSSTNLNGYSATISGLYSGTKYYYRPYAKNAGGTGYGSESNLTTLVLLTLPTPPTGFTSTQTTSNITITISGISVTNSGSEPISQYGLCYIASTTAIPASTNNPTAVVTTTTAPASFSISVTLPIPTSNTTYRMRVFMQNAGGFAYSDVITYVLGSTGISSGPTISTN